jgi:aryl-alcohol dehydrogenase-like predicted oxidoreductase
VNDILTIGGDLTVQRLGFGAMRITGEGIWGHPDDPQAAKDLLRHVVASGVNLIDTADAYGPDVSEDLIAAALWPYLNDLVIATKGGLLRSGPGKWHADGRPEHLRAACEASLRRLRLERIDLYQFHRPDPKVPLEESIGALAALRAEGKIRHVGVSNVTTDELARARSIVEIVSVQNRYNLHDRHSEDVLDACTRDGLAFIPWFPLATGDLAKHGGPVSQLANAHGAAPSQIALAWLLHRSPMMLPIPGTSSREHFDENLQARTLRLSDGEYAELDALTRAGEPAEA